MGKDYNIAKTSAVCTTCERPLDPGEPFVAIIREMTAGFQREDYHVACYESLDAAQQDGADSVFGFWRSRIAEPQEKKKLFVDDELLVSFFERLADSDDETKQSFRYVLALVLMRKKLLVYDRLERGEDGTETWLMHLRGDETVHRVLDPKMDDQKVASVSDQLGQILEAQR